MPNVDLEKDIPLFKTKILGTNEMVTEKIFENNQFYLMNIWSSWCIPCRDEHTFLMNLKNQKNIKFIQDSQSGTGGDLLHIQKELKNESEFLLWFVDNLCALDITKMRKTFKEKNSLACIATRTKRKEETGFAVVDDGLITEFKEKPMMKLQLSECLGIYMLGKEIIERIKKKKKKQVNLSFDILQELSKEGKVSAHDIKQREWIDAESPMILERNEKLVTKIIKQMGL